MISGAPSAARRLVAATQTAARYRLYALPDGKRPGLVQVEAGGAAIACEVWELPAALCGSFVAGIPAPLGIGKVVLADGAVVNGFICESIGVAGARDITGYGGWRAWLAESPDTAGRGQFSKSVCNPIHKTIGTVLTVPCATACQGNP
jgi:hypothetical protein